MNIHIIWFILIGPFLDLRNEFILVILTTNKLDARLRWLKIRPLPVNVIAWDETVNLGTRKLEPIISGYNSNLQKSFI